MRTRLSLLALTPLFLVACRTTVSQNPSQLAAQVTGDQAVAPAVTGFTGGSTELDMDQSSVTFQGRSSLMNHDGRFTRFNLRMTLDSATPSDLTKATIRLSLDPTSITTDTDMLNGHLQKDDFFDTANNPEIVFVTTSITPLSGNAYTLKGYLTVKQTVKEVSFPATISDDGIAAHFDFPRKDFGIGNDSYGDKLLSDTDPVDVKLVFQK